ncbi:MAG: RNA methyltransferase [Burkholderiaceae bacterium]|nr:RNA methyltransferase [Burkholderiaceae bacterium]
MDADLVTSPANPRFRRLRSLIASSRDRHREGRSVLEGIHLVESWLGRPLAAGSPAPPALELAVARRALGNPAVRDLLARADVAPLVLQDRLFDSLGTMPSPAPLIAVVPTPAPALPATLDTDTVILDRVQDPGNVGAILRTAAAAGIARVVTTPGTAWCWAPKVLRAAMGAHFALAVHESQPWETLVPLLRVPLAGTLAHGGDPLYGHDLVPACAWVFGSEGEGIDPGVAGRLDWRLTIPQVRAVESLNVAAAAAVCLFEQRRQRGADR